MIFTTGLLIFHIRMVISNTTTKEELKSFFLNPFGNPYQRSKSDNCKSVLFPKKAKMDVLDIFEYNKKMYEEQQKYKSELKKVDEKDNETNISIKNNNNNNVGSKEKFDDNHVDSKEKFDVHEDEDKKDISEKRSKILEKKSGNSITRSQNENIEASSKDNMLDPNDIGINIKKESSKPVSINNSISSGDNYTNYFDVEESQSYIPGVVNVVEIDNNKDNHIAPLIKDESTKKASSREEKEKNSDEKFIKGFNEFKEGEENEISK